MSNKSIFVCQNCGYESIQWLGRCPSCKEFTTFSEEIILKNEKNIFAKTVNKKSIPSLVSEIITPNYQKIPTNDIELNRVLDNGIVPGSIILLAGDPGIGKSTLLLQLAIHGSIRTLYVSGEESESQIKLRADRIGVKNKECFILNETLIENILSYLSIKKNHHQLIIIDSIQTLYSNQIASPIGSISQIRDEKFSANRKKLAKIEAEKAQARAAFEVERAKREAAAKQSAPWQDESWSGDSPEGEDESIGEEVEWN